MTPQTPTPNHVQNPKEVAGRAAAQLVESGMIVGLGTGSTVYFTLVALAERMASEGLSFRGVPTSIDTETKARDMGIPLVTLDQVDRIDLTIDGADEADGEFRLTKGGGGALLREKVVAYLSNRMAVVMTPDKLVARLGKTFALPVEVVPFAASLVERALVELGAEAKLRSAADGSTYVTDNANHILDATFPDGIESPAHVEAALAKVPGMVESGLFIGLATELYMGKPDGTCEILTR
ncbi:MAG: ribose-5-phosphate isomerase RpiA [Planctomycetes bacterium]|nr:ribose-5-phosphate isomerase RpiA [Planctomycetota bacterium]